MRSFVLAFLAVVAASAPAHADLDAAILDAKVKPLAEKTAGGRLGVGVLDVASGQTWYLDQSHPFPMQSVFKAPLGVAVMQAVDRHRLALEQPVTIARSDLAMQWSPIAKEFGTADKKVLTVKDLVKAAVSFSDNTAADVLMRLVGGPKAVTAALVDNGISGIRVDRYERELQPDVVGVPPYVAGDVIDQKEWEGLRAAMPVELKKASLKAYLEDDPRDTATPEGAVAFLAALDKGALISPVSTAMLIRLMTDTPSGPNRIKAGLPHGATLAHKTGGGPDVEGVNSASNDIGIATLPGGRKVIIAVFLAGSTAPEAERDALFADVARAVVEAVR